MWLEVQKQQGKPEIEITSLSKLSKYLWGIHRRELTIIGGRPSQFKSSLALQIANDISKQGFTVHFYSFEMSEEAMIKRLLCNSAFIDNSDFREYPIKYKEQFEQFKAMVKDRKLVITYNIGTTITDLQQAIQDLPVADVVIVDYIQAIRKMEFDKISTINEYILKFREMAVKKNFAAILISQINRDASNAEDKRPKLWQLKSSGFLEEHADNVLLTHWDYHYNSQSQKDDFEIIIAKQRDGETGTIKIKICPSAYKFFNE